MKAKKKKILLMTKKYFHRKNDDNVKIMQLSDIICRLKVKVVGTFIKMTKHQLIYYDTFLLLSVFVLSKKKNNFFHISYLLKWNLCLKKQRIFIEAVSGVKVQPSALTY